MRTTIELVGGPGTLDPEERIVMVDAVPSRIRLPHRGGHEHFSDRGAAGTQNGGRARIFGWDMRTEVAE